MPPNETLETAEHSAELARKPSLNCLLRVEIDAVNCVGPLPVQLDVNLSLLRKISQDANKMGGNSCMAWFEKG